MLRRFFRDEQGATAVEYGLIVTVLGIGLVVSLRALSVDLNQAYQTVADSFPK